MVPFCINLFSNVLQTGQIPTYIDLLPSSGSSPLVTTVHSLQPGGGAVCVFSPKAPIYFTRFGSSMLDFCKKMLGL